MKETKRIIEDKVENVRQAEVNTETQFIGSITTTKKNLTLFGINRITLEVKPAEYKSSLIVDVGSITGIKRVKEVITEENTFYTLALRKASALKKYQDFLLNGPKK